jgi:hypothetical protein
MNKSESIIELAKAMAQFQGEVKNPKNTENNPFYNSKYAPLSEILNISRPIMGKYGLSVIQSPSTDADKVTIHTLIMHSSGQWIEPEPLTIKADKVTAQGAGSAITYARRYVLSAILGMSSEDDDDGNNAEGDNKNTGNNASQQHKKQDNKTPGTQGNATNNGDKKDEKGQDGNKQGQEEKYNCESCRIEIPKAVNTLSQNKYKKSLCSNCQKTYAKAGVGK